MTTIAYRGGYLAGDQRTTDSGSIMPGRYTKVRRNSKGWIYGCAGQSGPIIEFDTFMQEFKPDKFPNKKTPRGDYRAIVVDPTGQVYDVDKGIAEALPPVPFYAIGSGTDAALGAMYHGASAYEAVKCAIEVDNLSGGDVDCIPLHIKEENECQESKDGSEST